MSQLTIQYLCKRTLAIKELEKKRQPCFVDLSGFGNIRYEIFYPKDRENCQPFYIMLKDLANKAKDDFWKGGMI